MRHDALRMAAASTTQAASSIGERIVNHVTLKSNIAMVSRTTRLPAHDSSELAFP
jgi:hypothetical protein